MDTPPSLNSSATSSAPLSAGRSRKTSYSSSAATKARPFEKPSNGVARVATVPPLAWRNGDFSSMLSGVNDPGTGLDTGQLVDPRAAEPLSAAGVCARQASAHSGDRSIDQAGAGVCIRFQTSGLLSGSLLLQAWRRHSSPAHRQGGPQDANPYDGRLRPSRSGQRNEPLPAPVALRALPSRAAAHDSGARGIFLLCSIRGLSKLPWIPHHP